MKLGHDLPHSLRRRRFAVLLASTLLCSAFTGCGAVYDVLQERGIETCNRIADLQQSRECKKQYKDSYQQYEKKREQAREKPSTPEPK